MASTMCASRATHVQARGDLVAHEGRVLCLPAFANKVFIKSEPQAKAQTACNLLHAVWPDDRRARIVAATTRNTSPSGVGIDFNLRSLGTIHPDTESNVKYPAATSSRGYRILCQDGPLGP